MNICYYINVNKRCRKSSDWSERITNNRIRVGSNPTFCSKKTAIGEPRDSATKETAWKWCHSSRLAECIYPKAFLLCIQLNYEGIAQ